MQSYLLFLHTADAGWVLIAKTASRALCASWSNYDVLTQCVVMTAL